MALRDKDLAEKIGLPFTETRDMRGKAEGSRRTQFKPGNGGRPKGARNILNEEFIKALQESFREGGLEAIQKVRDNRPQDYLKVLASILPKQVDVTIDPIEQLTEEDLARQLSGLLEAISGRIAETGLTGRASLAEEELKKQARALPSLH